MPQLPPVVWIALACIGLVFITLGALTAAVILRKAKTRWVSWPGRRILMFLVAASIPWLVVWLAPLRIVANIDGTLELIAWLLAALAGFALLILIPLAALMTSVIWWRARSARAWRR